ncbi:MAG: histidine phosphatase family protein, partial [Thermomicrobiales bacterium]
MTSRERRRTPVTAILVRHAQPDVQPDRAAGVWPLRPEGWQAAQALGRRLRAFGLLQVVTSDEVKAIQTGEALIPVRDVTTDARFGEQGLGT